MESFDDDLEQFGRVGAPPLPASGRAGHVEHDGAQIWYAAYGEHADRLHDVRRAPVVLLHGGLGHSGNWGHQVPALLAAGHDVITIDSRGHGRSTRDARPYSYELMASDVHAVLDELEVERAAFVGWSDGACTALIFARQAPGRVAGVLFFGCNMDPSGAQPFEATPVIERCFSRHVKDYAQLSATPSKFDEFVQAVSTMQKTQPEWSARELAEVRVPVTIVHSEHDEFIRREHAEYLSRSIPGARWLLLDGVSHFAPLQRPEQFNRAIQAFLTQLDAAQLKS
ncbi:alpha/beta fold hydrolase [Paraburkholderia rhizosphaerae]|uniref:Pimeloyl-ACP methyl ester carboxylesterase n=1 Tax=Paraburkholderia rhizosphaerae TaxID=480658 RepID=A0A4R8LV07_9BURK|nr:alpha/beta hydrolase [Paraburkholderia rhizosphaerae]TDY51544.1 pimeloyl-ACP methyl ester carboxylesterase [Paraburkholderia rhizosphaerae]